MSDSPRETQNQNARGEAPNFAEGAQASQSQGVQRAPSILAEVLADAREVLSQEEEPPSTRQVADSGPIRQSAQSVQAIPTFLEPEAVAKESVPQERRTIDPEPEAAISTKAIHEPAPLNQGNAEDPIFEELGLCTEERRQLIEPIDDFNGYDPDTGLAWSRGAPRILNVLAIPQWCGAWQRRSLSVAAILLACAAPVAWAVVMAMPPAESPRTATASLQLESLPGPLSIVEIDPDN